jgi:hypothetical protein
LSKTAKPPAAPMELKEKAYYVRKRDKMLVSIHKLSRFALEYTTHPMLEVWPTSRASFLHGFRQATKEEIEREEAAR